MGKRSLKKYDAAFKARVESAELTEVVPTEYRGWPATVTCGGSVCFVSSCGDGRCPYCFIEGMENLATKGWAVYTCMSGESVTGKALPFHTLPFNARLGPFCG